MALPWNTWSARHGKFVKGRTDVAVVCFAKGDYYEAQSRTLFQTFAKYNPDIRVFIFHEYTQFDSPTQQEIPYAFKYYAVQKVHSMGYPMVLWCDSVLKLQRPIDSLLSEVAQVGVYLAEDGWKTGQFANDRCLNYFGVTRDQAMEITAIWACFMGFDFRNPITHEFMRRWKAAMDAGIFHGNHRNMTQTESTDPRCLGHRHDQSCAELISHQMKIPRSLQCVALREDLKTPHTYFVGRGW